MVTSGNLFNLVLNLGIVFYLNTERVEVKVSPLVSNANRFLCVTSSLDGLAVSALFQENEAFNGAMLHEKQMIISDTIGRFPLVLREILF